MRISNRVIDDRSIIINFLEKLHDVIYHMEPTTVLTKKNFGDYFGVLSMEGQLRDLGLSHEECGVYLENTSPLRETYLDVILIFMQAFT